MWTIIIVFLFKSEF